MLFGACLRRKLLQLLIIITKCEFVQLVAVTSWSRAAFGDSEPPAILLKMALPTGEERDVTQWDNASQKGSKGSGSWALLL